MDPTSTWSADGGLVAVHDNNGVCTFTWTDDKDLVVESAQAVNVDLASVEDDGALVRIFPQVRTLHGFKPRYRQVAELQLDDTAFAWDPELPIAESVTGEPCLAGLPTGFVRTVAYGLGLQRGYQGLVHAVQDATSCTVLRIGARHDGPEGAVFHLGLQHYLQYVHAVDLNRARGHSVVSRINRAQALNTIADLVGAGISVPTTGRHPLIQAMTREITDNVPLDAAERSALVARTTREARTIASEAPHDFGRLREGIELVSLEVLVDRFAVGLKGPMAKDEAKWQTFFENNLFALQQLFSTPVALFGTQLELRMPNLHRAGGRVADFVLVNPASRHVVVVEIKTPATALLGRRYRGAGGAEVYPPSTDLAGAVAQLQAQIESATTDFGQLVTRTPGSDPVDTTSVQGAVAIGSIAGLDAEKSASLARYRSGLHGVTVLTFDEVHQRLVGLHSLLSATRT